MPMDVVSPDGLTFGGKEGDRREEEGGVLRDKTMNTASVMMPELKLTCPLQCRSDIYLKFLKLLDSLASLQRRMNIYSKINVTSILFSPKYSHA